MDTCLDLNGIQLTYDTEAIGQTIIRAAQGKIAAPDLADWLRARA